MFTFISVIGCEDNEENSDSPSKSDVRKKLDEPSSFEKEVEEIVINEVGTKDEMGNERVEDVMVLDGEKGEQTIKDIEQNEKEDDLNDSTKTMLRETSITINISTTEGESGKSAHTAYIFKELYDVYDPDVVTIFWNISDVSDEDANLLYVLKKETERELDWDSIFEDNLAISPFFVKDIDTFIDWPI